MTRSAVGRATPNSVSSVRAINWSVFSTSSASLARLAGDEDERRPRLLGDLGGLGLGDLADGHLGLVHLGQLGDDSRLKLRPKLGQASPSSDLASPSRAVDSSLSAASWSAAAGLAAVLARSPSAACIGSLARIKVFWSVTPGVSQAGGDLGQGVGRLAILELILLELLELGVGDAFSAVEVRSSSRSSSFWNASRAFSSARSRPESTSGAPRWLDGVGQVRFGLLEVRGVERGEQRARRPGSAAVALMAVSRSRADSRATVLRASSPSFWGWPCYRG